MVSWENIIWQEKVLGWRLAKLVDDVLAMEIKKEKGLGCEDLAF